jgi:hypothetical protein
MTDHDLVSWPQELPTHRCRLEYDTCERARYRQPQSFTDKGGQLRTLLKQIRLLNMLSLYGWKNLFSYLVKQA